MQRNRWLKQKRNLQSEMNWKRIETQAREEYAKLKAENELLKAEMDELKEHIDQLEAAEGATCPLCGQALSEEHRQIHVEAIAR